MKDRLNQPAKPKRDYPTVTFTFPQEQADYIDRRWKELRPQVSSRSHFMQLLVDAERKGHCEIIPKGETQLLLAEFAA